MTASNHPLPQVVLTQNLPSLHEDGLQSRLSPIGTDGVVLYGAVLEPDRDALPFVHFVFFVVTGLFQTKPGNLFTKLPVLFAIGPICLTPP
jgi:hypothetical protein